MGKIIWHKQDDIPELGKLILIVSCWGKNDINVDLVDSQSMFNINLKKLYGKDYRKFMQSYRIVAWAYIEDLIDEKTDKFIKKEASENFEKYINESRVINKEWDEFVEKGGMNNE